MRQLLRVLLWPVSILFGLLVQFRNHLYNIGYKKSIRFQATVISVGNLGVGGNGKTPMVEYLIKLLGARARISVLSRGYGRKTKGFRIAASNDRASDIGDEPLQMFLKFKPDLTVAVGESRVEAIPRILFEKPEVNTIILDDAFQHRSVNPQFSILVTDYWTPFFRDFMLPSGRLREPRNGAKRADAVVITKCPPNISTKERELFVTEVQRYCKGIPVYFSCIEYLKPLHIFTQEVLMGKPSVLLFSGIAKPETLVQHVSDQYLLVDHLRFKDHFQYTIKEVEKIKRKFVSSKEDQKILLTTEKDMVRMMGFQKELQEMPIYYLPIQCLIIDQQMEFETQVLNSLVSYHHSKN